MQNFFDAVFLENRGELVHHEDVVLNLLNEIFRGAGEQLHQKAARSKNVLVRPDENTEPAGRRNLFTLHQIGGEVLRNFTRNELDTSNVRFAQAEIPADGT